MDRASLALAALGAVTALIVILTAVCIYKERKGPAKLDFNDR